MQPNPYSNVLKGSACGSLLPLSFPVKHLFWVWAILWFLTQVESLA